MARNKIWLQIRAEIQFADSTSSIFSYESLYKIWGIFKKWIRSLNKSNNVLVFFCRLTSISYQIPLFLKMVWRRNRTNELYFKKIFIYNNNATYLICILTQIRSSTTTKIVKSRPAKSRIGRIIYNFKFRSFLYCFQYGRSGKPTSV